VAPPPTYGLPFLKAFLLACLTQRNAVMEKYVRNARFCLICNYVSKIIPALQSRCTRFRFMPLPEQFVRTRLDYICAAEQ
jgi:DNA polymerase III delta prime subunit